MVDKKFCRRVSSASLGGYDVKYNTWDLCERAIKEGLKGDFAEAGVYKGSHPMIMAEVAKRWLDDRLIHLFDSFEGVPRVRQERDRPEAKTYGFAEDNELVSDGNAMGTIPDCENAFRDNGADLKNCRFHKGWFQETLPVVDWPDFSVLRFDVDLLESNELCFKYLYSKLEKGGYFITDDWGHPGSGTRETWQAEFKRLLQIFDTDINDLIITEVEGQESTAWWQKQ